MPTYVKQHDELPTVCTNLLRFSHYRAYNTTNALGDATKENKVKLTWSMTRSNDQRRWRAKRQQRLRRLTGQAIGDYRMIEEGDKVMVCLSGGKDSYTLLDMLISLRKSAPVSFDLIAVNLDQKQPGFPEHVLPDYMATKEIPFYVIERDTYSTVKRVVPEGKTTCALCSRLRVEPCTDLRKRMASRKSR